MQTDTPKRSVAAAGRRPHPHTRAAPRAVGPRSPRSCTKRLRPLCVSPVPPQPAGRPPWRCRASSRGSLSREPFHSEGQSHTCPHQAHSPQARHGPVTWGRARTPSHGAQHSPRRPGVGPHPSVSPRGLNTGTRRDGTPPPPGSVGARGRGGGLSLSACREAWPAQVWTGSQLSVGKTGTKATSLDPQTPPCANPSGRLGLFRSATPALPPQVMGDPKHLGSAHRGKRRWSLHLFLPVPRTMSGLTMCSGFSAP